jgi:hypothetical protein
VIPSTSAFQPRSVYCDSPLEPNVNPAPRPILLLFPCVLDPARLTRRPLKADEPSIVLCPRIRTLSSILSLSLINTECASTGVASSAPSFAPLRCVRAFSFREHGRPHHRLPRFAVSTRSHFGNMVARTIACPASLYPLVFILGTWPSAPSPAPLCFVRAFSFRERGLGSPLSLTHTFLDSLIERLSTF